MRTSLLRLLGLALLPLACMLAAAPLTAADPKAINDQMKEVAGAAEFLRSVPKHFATLKAMDRAKRRVTLLMEGDKESREWPLAADAELKLNGWWGRLDQFTIGDRVWVWLQLDRVKQPIAISMLADELSEQDIHGTGMPLEARDEKGATFKQTSGKSVTLPTAKEKLDNLKVGDKFYVQTRDGAARLILDAAAFE